MPQHTHKQGNYIWCVHNDCVYSSTPLSSWKKLKQHMGQEHNVSYNLKLVISKSIPKRNKNKQKKK